MKRLFVALVLFACLILPARATAQKAALVLANSGSPATTDLSVISHLEEDLGIETVLIDQTVDGATKNDILDTEEPDVIIILESVGSGNVMNQLNGREEPIIVQEAFVYDDMGFVVGTAGCTDCWGDLGNDFGNQSNVTDLDIVNDEHPIVRAAGLDGADTIPVYEVPGRIQWIQNFIDAVEVLAVATGGFDGDGDGVSDAVTAFVVEPGAVLVDGSRLAGLRIGGWAHTEGGDVMNATPDGLALWDAMLIYALGEIDPGVCTEPPATATRAIVPALTPEEATCRGDFKDGEVISVAIEVGDLRAAAGDCVVPESIRVTEQPPADWAVSDVSDGGTVADGAITWTLTAADLQAAKTLTYSVTAAAPGAQERFTFRGELVELDAAGDPVEGAPAGIAGDVALLSDPDDCPAKAALVLANSGSPGTTDQSIINHLEQDLGMQTVLIDQTVDGPTKNSVLDSERPDVIIVLESVSSGNVAGQLNDREEPILVQEAFMYDDMGLVAGVDGCTDCWGDLGNDFGNQSNVTDLDIVHPDHPIIRAAGLDDADTIPVYEIPGRIQWIQNFIEEVEVLAVATGGFDGDGDGVSDAVAAFVVEPGAVLVDGSLLAGLRLGAWPHTEGGDVTNATPDGLALWDAMLNYAIGAIDDTPDEPTFVRGDADSTGTITLTDGIAILGWLFGGDDEPACLDAADTNDDGGVVINDAILVFSWLFAGGQAPAPPTPPGGDYAPEDCGVDVGEDALGCLMASPKCSG